jgi:hypothetical protein
MIYFNMPPDVKHLIIVLWLMVHSDVTNKDNSSVKLIQYVTSADIEKCNEISTLYQTLSLHAMMT